jgi:hypothetical protein
VSGILIAVVASTSSPPQDAPVFAQTSIFCQLFFRHRNRPVGFRRNVKCVGWAIGFTDEAGLAVILTGDHGDISRNTIEDVGWTDFDANVATNATAFTEQGDHYATAE